MLNQRNRPVITPADDAIHQLLYGRDLNTITIGPARLLLRRVKRQLQTRYQYLVGDWRNARRAKNTRTGEFASLDEVRQYLDN